ncbi:MAG: sodium-dependent transporter [Porcipelethomonas sp.]
MKQQQEKRSTFSGKLGFVLSAAGASVGLGNIWRFPYLAAKYGGGIFLLVYILLALTFGYTMIVAETAIGRMTRKSPVGAYHSFGKSGLLSFGGWINAIIPVLIVPYYSVIGGWVMKYLFTYIFTSGIDEPDKYFQNFSSSPAEPILWQLLFCAVSIIIVIRGISNGIEKISKIFLPLLAAFIIIIAINSVSLPGASEGVKFFLIPDTSHINSFKDIFSIILNAMGQVFFSLSLGMGTLITYGSYLSRDSSIQKNAFYIPLFDLIIAVLACFAILPAVFAFRLEPSGGSGLIFRTLPYVFGSMKFGRICAVIFFALVFFAAVTSSISLVEVIASYFIDSRKWSRPKACIIPGIVFAGVGIVASLSFGILSNVKIMGESIFDFLTILSDKILMPIGGFFMCILTGYIWGMPEMFREMSSGGKYKIYFRKTISFLIKFLAPAMILIIFITSFI